MKRIVSLVKPQKLKEAAATKEWCILQENNTFFKSNRQFTLLTGLSLLLPRSQVCWVLSSALDLIILPLRHALSDPQVCGCEFTACFCFFFFLKKIKRSWKVLSAEKERRGRRNKRHRGRAHWEGGSAWSGSSTGALPTSSAQVSFHGGARMTWGLLGHQGALCQRLEEAATPHSTGRHCMCTWLTAVLSAHSLHGWRHFTPHTPLQTVYALLTQLCNKRYSEIPTEAAVQKNSSAEVAMKNGRTLDLSWQ